ncbi:histidine kinase dimerization/phosphoacceptor domain -containing protein [Sulfitobacter sp. D35]|uniref:histidine kinase dimerization/phosphoacceptor domain -containing protein n=1 Tax=Sulfitobacter sp. D35 TaxID=3083252 RepID=UPI00296FA17C|nr:histidine kinase dimerization/phosphoacceptor domain -containing protein [Sulfitobacter sp. D35]MDW4499896.1 histidine kinase dimerization/phosphoacceptor domain -containing protein [Sulfitobacter sp. D35]
MQMDAKWYHSLRFRMLGLMSLALLPIGLIAISQTQSVSEKAQENAELALLVLTESAALEQRLVIQRAFGAAQGLSALLPEIADEREGCVAIMSDFVERSPSFSFAGFLPVSGIMTCSSSGKLLDFSTYADFDDAVESAEPRIFIESQAGGTATSLMTVSQPVRSPGGRLIGFIQVSIPHTPLQTERFEDPSGALIDIITFNNNGELLTAAQGLETAPFRLPSNVTLDSLIGEPAQAFTANDRNGDYHSFAVVPIDEDAIYVMGIWDNERELATEASWAVPATLFPALMWLASLGVALFSIHRLVTSHVRRLGVQMADFARSRKMPPEPKSVGIPSEVQRIQNAFLMMTDSILRDEAQLEDAVRSRNALIKEVHHRVKNNLQLISSIINMQIRETDDAGTARVLRRIQDRVLSLATIHRDLYQTSTGGQVDVGHLVQEIVESSIDIGTTDHDDVRLETDIEPIRLYPDQAVPMSLLAAEAATNAMKYFGAKPGQTPHISVSLKADADRTCRFEFINSIGESREFEGTGMGTQLINAFGIQLGADVKLEETEDTYRVKVTFKAADFTPEVMDF